jgi:tRNA G18 (ribose-2'-O)-methylase SpoU
MNIMPDQAVINLLNIRVKIMKATHIKTKNAAYQKLEVLKTNRSKRYRYGEFFVEGVRNINEAIENRWHISSFIYTEDKPLSDWASNLLRTIRTDVNYILPFNLMQELSGKEDTSELMAIVKMRKDDPLALTFSDNPVIALFDRPSNRGNLGTIIRSCDALGVEALLITGHGVDLYDPEVIVSSMGSFFKVPAVRIASNNQLIEFIDSLRAKYPGLKLAGTTSHNKQSIYDTDLSSPVMFLIGNETEGLSGMLSGISDQLVTIPMSPDSSASSLNVACAATVMFYEAARQRKEYL